MHSYNEFSTLINEGFLIKGDTVFFDPNVDSIIKTSFGKGKNLNPYRMKLPFGVLYAVYRKNKTENSTEYDEVLKSIKGQSQKLKIDADSYDKFLKRTALYISRMVIDEKIDTIILMESSSKLLVDISIRLNKYLPKYYEMFTYDKGIFKNPNLEDIFIDQKSFDLSDSTVKELKKQIEKSKESGYFSIKKFKPQFRRSITNWLKMKDQLLSKIVDKNVLILDDVVTTGSTIIEASKLLEEAGASKVVGIALIKGI
jgi:hypothetical protein